MYCCLFGTSIWKENIIKRLSKKKMETNGQDVVTQVSCNIWQMTLEGSGTFLSPQIPQTDRLPAASTPF
jgi:hypothetical protein